MTRILAIDEGTTSTRAAVLDEDGGTVASASREFHQSFPQPGRVEHDALEIWRVTREMIGRLHRHHRSARDDGRVGPDDGSPAGTGDRLAGHARR